ncbi:MAG: hypothetical protein AAB466_12035 [Verrucomicrobiota bacterium]
MRSKFSFLREHVQRMGTAYLVLVLSLISTAMVDYSVSQYVLARD